MAFDDIKISDDDDGQRVDRVLRRLRPTWPYVLVQKLLRKGAIKIDGKRAKVDARVMAGQMMRIPRDENETAALKKMGTTRGAPDRVKDLIQVLFEDDHILVIDKPPGLAVQGGSGLKLHLEMMLKQFAKKGVNPRLVHRLDRETSGVMVLARGAMAARHLSDQFRDRTVQKKYYAVVAPPPKSKRGLIDAPLSKIKSGPYVENMAVTRGGDAAQTEFQVLSKQGGNALVAFMPHTGRTHQIRVHAAHIGCPLVGDVKYGGKCDVMKTAKVKVRVMLHAAELSFMHPKLGEQLVFSASMPKDMKTLCEKLGLSIDE